VPAWTMNCLPVNPPPVTVCRLFNGFVQLTGTWFPATAIVGWPVAVLHSVMPPGPSLKPDTVTVAGWLSLSSTAGETVMVVAASVGISNPAVATMSTAAAARAKSPLRLATTLRSVAQHAPPGPSQPAIPMRVNLRLGLLPMIVWSLAVSRVNVATG
jgi:hypothetical protein